MNTDAMLTLLIAFFLVAILFSFLCSMWEAVLLSITPSYARIQMQEGSSIGRHLQEFKENIDRPLAAILTLNTIAHTVGAIGVGSQATAIWAETSPIITTVVVPVVMTLGILILSEIIPKTIGANFWKELAPFTVASLNLIMWVLAPLIWMTQLITRVLKKEKDKSVLSRSDFMVMTEIGEQEGIFHSSESTIIKNLLRFHTIDTKSIMTPRTVVLAAAEEMTLQAFHDANPHLRFSRIPTYHQDEKDRVTGYFLKDALLSSLLEGKGEEFLSVLRRDIMVVKEGFPITDLYNRMLEKREHIALVIDEFGGMAGIVTMEDVIETLLGLEIVDEFDNTEDMRKLARQRWKKRAASLGLIEESSS
ncbi:MAG: CNNM domain-containing protein [Gammaproteobacteria bacterium]